MRMQEFHPDEQAEHEQVLDLIRANPSITIGELCEILYCAENKIKRVIRICKETGRITRVGSSRNGYWKIN